MDESLRDLMKILQMLAVQPDAGADGTVPSFESNIGAYLAAHTADKHSATADLCEALAAEASEQPSESRFWTTVEEYVGCPRR
jgi:hypothetical protein